MVPNVSVKIITELNNANLCISIEVPSKNTNHSQVMINIIDLAAVFLNCFDNALNFDALIE